MLTIAIPQDDPFHADALIVEGRRLQLRDGSWYTGRTRPFGRLVRDQQARRWPRRHWQIEDWPSHWPGATEIEIHAISGSLELRTGDQLLAEDASVFLDGRFEPPRLTVGNGVYHNLLSLRRGSWRAEDGTCYGPLVIADRDYFRELPPLPAVVPVGLPLRPSGLAERLPT